MNRIESKPGIRTTEFWVGLVMPQLFALLVLFGVFTPETSDAVQSEVLTAVAASKELVAAVISGLSSLGYTIGRGIAKGRTDPNNK